VTTKAQPFVPVNLDEITRDVLSDLEVRIEQTGATVEIEPLPMIDADPLQMRQLMQNLIGNALKFRQSEVSPTIKISGGSAGINSTYGNICQISVADNGIGFEEKYTDRIFTVFQRLHGRGEYEGSGVGLAVCRKIVERHHGTITARSAPNEGATFVITLPVKQLEMEINQ
jgi:light-regulated signal transduction histidine kinase (bacteriophytochrome)